MTLRQLLLPYTSALLLAALGPCLSHAAATSEATTIVMAKDCMFAPTSLTVRAGSTVTWTNNDEQAHTVVSDSGLFRSGALDTNERYVCSIHPRMMGTIILRQAACVGAVPDASAACAVSECADVSRALAAASRGAAAGFACPALAATPHPGVVSHSCELFFWFPQRRGGPELPGIGATSVPGPAVGDFQHVTALRPRSHRRRFSV